LLRSTLAAFCLVVAARALAASNAVERDGFIVVDSVDALRGYVSQNGVKVRLKPGTYRLDRAPSRHFIEISADDSHWDLRGVTLVIANELFHQFGAGGASAMYCAFTLSGNRIVFEGLTTVNAGGMPGIQSRNKIFNVTGSNVILRDLDITTSGSSPWGYGSLYGISGGDVRKMNGIRVGAPARDVQLIRCRVHMRAMGHAIFVQGAQNTLIQDCHVDGLLKATNELLAEKSGYAFERDFMTRGHDYIEGIRVGRDGRILPDEMIALSEDGIRLYERAGSGQPTGRTTIIGCTVTRMRRGFCTGLGPGADTIIDCEARDCVAAGFNLGSNDQIQNSRADARYAEALSLPYVTSHHARVDLEIVDSRGGLANDLLAIINGRDHHVTLRTRDPHFVPAELRIELATRQGYAHYQKSDLVAKKVTLINETTAAVFQNAGASECNVTSRGAVHRTPLNPSHE
jgi:hypothetical protein